MSGHTVNARNQRKFLSFMLVVLMVFALVPIAALQSMAALAATGAPASPNASVTVASDVYAAQDSGGNAVTGNVFNNGDTIYVKSGASVSLSGVSGDVYYTTDGTAPITVSGSTYTFSGTLYTTPIVINADTTVTAQVYDSSYDTSVSQTSIFYFKVGQPPMADTQAPTTVSGINYSNLTQTSVQLGWGTATDNVGVVGYYVYQDNYLIQTVANNVYQYDATGLTANTQYTFSVAAFDAAGNVGPLTPITITTQSSTQANPAPTPNVVQDVYLTVGGGSATVPVTALATDSDGDMLMVANATYDVPGVANVTVSSMHDILITPVGAGTTTVTADVYDGFNKVPVTFTVHVTNVVTNNFTVSTTFKENNAAVTSLAPGGLLEATSTVTNNQTTDQQAILIVALYDSQGTMQSVSFLSKNVAAGATENFNAGFTLPSDVTGYTVKAFVWDGTDLFNTTQQPLSNVVQIPSP